jgi:hypothetical protein
LQLLQQEQQQAFQPELQSEHYPYWQQVPEQQQLLEQTELSNK